MEKYVFCFWLCYFSTWFLFFSGFYVFFLYLGFSGFLFLWRINYVPFVVLVFVVFFNGFLCFLCFLVCFALWGCVGPLVFAGSWFCIFYLNSINMFLRRDWHMFSSSVLTSLFYILKTVFPDTCWNLFSTISTWFVFLNKYICGENIGSSSELTLQQ